MVNCLSTKKCIVTDLVQLALILNILHNSNVLFNPEDPQFDLIGNNSTQFPDLGNEILPDGIFGSTFYSRTSAYHQSPEFNRTPPHLSAKQLEDPPASSIINETNEWILRDDNAYYRERIIEELRRLSVQRYSELPGQNAKGSLTFQDITAYLFNNTNEGQTTNGGQAVTVPEVPSTTLPTFEPLPSGSSFQAFPPMEDVGNNGTLESDVAVGDVDLQLLQEIEEISANFKDGFPIQELFSQNNLRADDLTLLEELQNQLNDESDSMDSGTSCLPPPVEIQGQAPSSSPLDFRIPSRLGNCNTNLTLTPNNTALPESLGPLESDVLVDDDFRELSWVDDLYPEDPAADMAEEEEDILQEFNLLISGLEPPRRRYDTDDITEEEMMDTISPYDIHGPVKMEGLMNSVPNVTVSSGEKIERQRGRGISSSGGSVSSHDDLLNFGEVDQVADGTGIDSLLDELWETDSGIFDSFLDSPPGRLDTDDENFRTSESSATHDPLERRRVSAGDSCSEESRDLEDCPSSSDEMLQTAPIHSAARPTPHPAQPRAFQVHGSIAGPLRGSGSEPRAWQDFPTFLNFPPSHGDPNGPIVPPSLPHHFGAHTHQIHHPFHHPTSLHHHHPHHAIHHHSPYGTPYTSESTRSALIHNATIPPPELHLNGSYPVEMGSLPSAVASSMHLTNTSEPMSDPTSSHYNKILENSHDALYYNSSSSHPNPDLSNQTSEGNLTSLTNDETLQLMDMMVMNEGMYAMRMIDNALSQNGGPLGGDSNLGVGASGYSLGGAVGGATTEDRMEASSDSAVSSMGSERVPPMIDPILSDNEWSESEHHQHSSNNYGAAGGDYSSGKLRGYDYFGKPDSRHRVVAPVPQKKHQMFGKRLLQDQGNVGGLHPFSLTSHPIPPYAATGGLHHSSNPSLDSIEMKYNACGIDFARHDSRIGDTLDLASSNHSYSLPPTHPDNPIMTARTQRAPPKEKPQKKEHMSRDEKKATLLGLPLTTDEIVNLPMDEFNERLSKHDLSETQLSLIRDIRRRGKNKVAAQNCRKRKIDQITQLENEVNVIRQRKESLLRENDNLVNRRNTIKDKYSQLYRHVFQNLRNPDGNPYNPQEWTLLQGTDGNVNLIPRQQNVPGTSSSSSYSTHLNNPSAHEDSGSLRRPTNRSNSSKSKEEIKKDQGGGTGGSS